MPYNLDTDSERCLPRLEHSDESTNESTIGSYYRDNNRNQNISKEREPNNGTPSPNNSDRLVISGLSEQSMYERTSDDELVHDQNFSSDENSSTKSGNENDRFTGRSCSHQISKKTDSDHELVSGLRHRSPSITNNAINESDSSEDADNTNVKYANTVSRKNGLDPDFISDDSDESESEVPAEEVERMLEEALGGCDTADDTGKKRSAPQPGYGKSKPFEEKHKKVLMEKESHHFEVLPEGWIDVTHESGLHIYLHKAGRVCTLARPYFLGPGNEEEHDIPLSAVPCLSYKKALENEADAAAAAQAEQENPPKPGELPSARIETIQENIEQNNLRADQVHQYAQRRFKFKTVKVMVRRRKVVEREKERSDRQLQRPTLPEGTKLISFPVLSNDTEDNNRNPKREWIMNPNGKSYVCILHEYIQHALKKQPTYQFAEIDDAESPYSATVTINDVQYGTGRGNSKKQAKSAAAKATLEMLIPEMRTKIDSDERMGGAAASKVGDQDLSLFDEIKIEDPRVAEFCAKTTEPSPHDVLLTCLQRNFGLGNLQISYQGNTLKHQRNEFTMRVGKHSATVVCKNKRDGKQRASQAILQALHPHVKSWGALLRLYGTGSVKSFKEKKMDEQEITLLQSKAAANQPNCAILDKLYLELRKIKERRDEKEAESKAVPTDDKPSVATSALSNVDL